MSVMTITATQTTSRSEIIPAHHIGNASISIGSQDQPAGADLSHMPREQNHNETPASDRRWTIYLLVHRSTMLRYVGLTGRPLEDRLRAHTYQARRIRAVRPGGLMETLRLALASGQTLTQAFDVEVLATAVSRDGARQLERQWIAHLGSRKPGGLNDMPGGGIGGRAGAIDRVIALSDGTVLCHESTREAILARNAGLLETSQPTLKHNMVYARLALGWPPAEALGYSSHEDGRGSRGRMIVEGQMVRSLRAASRVTGLGISALRSRLHRRFQAGVDVEVGHDMRRTTDNHTPRRSAALGLRLPGSSQPLTVSAYAARIGLPKSTVLYRWHMAIRGGIDPAQMPPVALLRQLTTGHDRRRCVMLQLPDGRRWTGGERELIRRVFADPALESSRAERLSESGIRRRLRLMPELKRHDPAQMATAFGFAPFIDGSI